MTLTEIHPDQPSKIKVRSSTRLKDCTSNTVSWIRILEDGRIELEYCDGNAGAEDHYGGDVAWICRTSTFSESRLRDLLASETNSPVNNDRTTLKAIERMFCDAWAVRNWLRCHSIPIEQEFESWP
jgi:hypothetical protein